MRNSDMLHYQALFQLNAFMKTIFVIVVLTTY